MRSRLQNQFLFLLKYIHITSFTIHQLICGIWHRQSLFWLNFEEERKKTLFKLPIGSKAHEDTKHIIYNGVYDSVVV